jgi:hypothetical protein
MDFQQLLAKMVELDQPAQEGNEFSGALAKAKETGQEEFEVDGKKYKVKEDGTVEACSMSPAPMEMEKPDTPPPSMSVNLNAQGMDDIAELMKLMTKVNPDMEKPEMPTMGMEPTIASIKPSMPPLKMLPDLDADNDGMPGGENPEMKKDKEEAFGNSLDDSEPDTMNIDAAIPDGDDLHKKKSMHKAAAGGDNAMAAESTDLRSQIRAELLQRLAEAKGAK